MSETLRFDIQLDYPGFTLDAVADVPLVGITALSGPSGSGKTTLLRVLAGLEQNCQSKIDFADQDWSTLRPEARGIGYVFQDTRLFPHLDVKGNLAYGAKRRATTADMVDAVIEALDLQPLLSRQPASLSGGETRRVALGRALASSPRILLMDEPLTGLDRARKLDLMPYIARAVADFNMPAIYVTHSRTEIGFLADRVLTIDDGQLIGWGTALPRLIGQVVNTAPGQIELALADHRIWLPGVGHTGEIWALPLGQDFILTTSAPELSNAAAVFSGRVEDVEPGANGCTINIFGQNLSLPWAREDGLLPQKHAPIWLCLPHVVARPVQIDQNAG